MKQRGAQSRKQGEEGRVNHDRGGDPTHYQSWGPTDGPQRRGPRSYDSANQV